MKKRYESVTCGGMDVHYKSSQVTFRDARGAVVVRERLDHTDRAAMRAQMGRWPKGIPIVLEASFGWDWVSDELERAGLNPQLSNCYKVEQMRKARGDVKTNKKDADLVSLLPAESTPWWQVWRAPAAVRDRREWMRFRSDLVGVQTDTKNRTHGLFHRHGIFFTGGTDLFGGVGRRFLAELCRDGRHAGGVLPAGALAALQGQVALITHLRTHLAVIARQLKEMLARDPLTKRLDGIPGFGLILSHTVQAEIGEIGRFRSHRALASYACLAPRADETGEANPTRAPLGRHLGDRGNRTLKWAFIEAAHGAVRHGGRWRAMFDRATDGGKKNRGRGYIQVARELVKMVYIVWSRNVAYMESPPARPGTRSVRPASEPAPRGRSRKQSRPGTGQPLHPMVQA
jgi:transposase